MSAMRVVSLEEATGLVAPSPIEVSATDWPAEIKHLSPSSIGKFLECPERWRRHYLLRERSRAGFWMFRGSVNHASVDWGLREKMRTGALPSITDVVEKFDELWNAELEKQGGVGEIIWEDTTPAAVKDETVKLVGAYHTQVSPSLNPIALEERFTLDTPGLPIPTIGYIDIEEERRLLDRKETDRRTKEPKPDWIMKGGIYSAVKQKPIEFHVSTKTKVPAVYTAQDDPDLLVPAWRLERAHNYIRRTAQLISVLYNERGPDNAWPGATIHPWACKKCGHRPNCPWWSD